MSPKIKTCNHLSKCDLHSLLTTKEVCKLLNISKWALYEWVEKGKLTPYGESANPENWRSGWRFEREIVNDIITKVDNKQENPFE